MISYTTFQDVIDHGIDYIGGNPSDQVRRDCIRAAQEAYRDIANAHNWTYLYAHGRVITTGSFDSGVSGATMAYQHTGGTYERMATISGDVWPDWSADGYVKVGQVAYKVDERKSATVITFDEVINPGADLDAGTAFQIYRDTYLLPEDYIAQDQALYERNFGGMSYTHPREWLYENRYVFSQGIPQMYTVTGDKKYPGRLVLRVYPWPMESKSIDYIYKRRPRALLTPLATGGTVALPEGSNALAGTLTNFSPKMVGAVIRLSLSITKAPSSLIMGNNPATFETVIHDWISPTGLVLQDAADQDYTGVQYTVSDSIDMEAGAMMNAYLRCVEKHLSMSRTLKDKPSAARQYLEALSEAKSADSRSFAGRSVNQPAPLRRRLRDYPIDLSQTQ